MAQKKSPFAVWFKMQFGRMPLEDEEEKIIKKRFGFPTRQDIYIMIESAALKGWNARASYRNDEDFFKLIGVK